LTPVFTLPLPPRPHPSRSISNRLGISAIITPRPGRPPTRPGSSPGPAQARPRSPARPSAFVAPGCRRQEYDPRRGGSTGELRSPCAPREPGRTPTRPLAVLTGDGPKCAWYEQDTRRRSSRVQGGQVTTREAAHGTFLPGAAHAGPGPEPPGPGRMGPASGRGRAGLLSDAVDLGSPRHRRFRSGRGERSAAASIARVTRTRESPCPRRPDRPGRSARSPRSRPTARSPSTTPGRSERIGRQAAFAREEPAEATPGDSRRRLDGVVGSGRPGG
jgi:hypothetical protein